MRSGVGVGSSVVIAGAIVAAVTLLVSGGAVETRAAGPAQPIEFDHAVHSGDGPEQYKIDCQYCHANARRSRSAGIPSVRRCMGCHQITAAGKPEVQKIHEYAREGRPIPWVRIHRVRGYVYFPHKRHIEANVTCQTCHGEVQKMKVVEQVAPLTMGWCVNCHVEKRGPLDCVVCHH